MSVSIYLSISLSPRISISLSIHLCLYPWSIYLSISLFVCHASGLSMYVFINLYLQISIYLSLSLWIYLSGDLSMPLSLFFQSIDLSINFYIYLPLNYLDLSMSFFHHFPCFYSPRPSLSLRRWVFC